MGPRKTEIPRHVGVQGKASEDAQISASGKKSTSKQRKRCHKYKNVWQDLGEALTMSVASFIAVLIADHSSTPCYAEVHCWQ